MQDTFFHLSTCKTCQRIIAELGDLLSSVNLRDLKSDHLNEEELDELQKISGSYESLFSRRSMKYREYNLKDQKLSEQDYRRYILDHYTFLKRPVLCLGEEIMIGSSKKVVERMKSQLAKS